ncbi:tetratricopeptide repeat protein [Streptomyces sp. NPDC007205]|uniref:tetratricopeptide repeat protein n=1 Tax=Streptomyces sp. NPDC007205 TaxID=3154316 RepID=UPI0033D31717
MSPRTNDDEAGERQVNTEEDETAPRPAAAATTSGTATEEGRPGFEESSVAGRDRTTPDPGEPGVLLRAAPPAKDARPLAPGAEESSAGEDEEVTPGSGEPSASLREGAPARDTEPLTPGAGERVVSLRRFAAAGRRRRVGQLVGCAALLAVALTGGAIAVGADRAPASVPAASTAVDPGVLGGGDLDASIAALQGHLRTQPKDSGGWATLGLAYVEQARTKGDPSRYPQAEQALKRSLALAPDSDQALAGRAALAAARHDFKDALTYADEALRQNPYSERALSSRIDALVELGRYAEASKAAGIADARKPGVPVFTRYAYVHELRGDVTTARRVLEQALAGAISKGDVAYVAAQLGQLAWNQGDYRTALTYYARALAADDTYLPALEGRARAQAAGGDRAAAIKGMETVVSRYPLPGPLVELGELYEARGAAGDRARARRQYALVDTWIALARANGVNADLDTALAAADHGDKTAALRAARAEWARRHTVHTADALAWALHVNGRDAEALPYARQATATGYHNAAFLYHRGMIELATGHRTAGRASLTSALGLNPGFSPLGAAEAREALEAAK